MYNLHTCNTARSNMSTRNYYAYLQFHKYILLLRTVRLASPCQMYTYSSDPMPPFFGPSAAIITALSAAHSHTAYLAATPSVSRCLFHSISCCSLQHRPSCLRAAAGRCKSPCAQRSPRRQLQRLLDCGTAVNSLQQLTTVPPDQHPTAIVPPDGEMPLTAKCH